MAKWEIRVRGQCRGGDQATEVTQLGYSKLAALLLLSPVPSLKKGIQPCYQ